MGNDRVIDDGIDAVASLGDHRRRRLYRYVVSHPLPSTRDDAAAATGLNRSVAAYHLDKLVAGGLLDVRFERRTGRHGPGAGRPAKLYVRPVEAVEVSLPRRDYALLAIVLAEAVEADPCGAAHEALRDAARRRGTDIAAGALARPAASRPAVCDVLAQAGYEPYPDGDVVRLRNCPFKQLAGDYRQLVCGANLALVEGIVAALGEVGDRAVLDPADDRCCVAIRLGGSSTARQAHVAAMEG